MIIDIPSNFGNENLIMLPLLLYPIGFIILGKYNAIHPPQYPIEKFGAGTMRTTNGYKTPSSRRSKENWVIAQKLFSRYCITSGIFILPIVLISCALFLLKVITTDILFILLFIIMFLHGIGVFVYCEPKLRK